MSQHFSSPFLNRSYLTGVGKNHSLLTVCFTVAGNQSGIREWRQNMYAISKRFNCCIQTDVWRVRSTMEGICFLCMLCTCQSPQISRMLANLTFTTEAQKRICTELCCDVLVVYNNNKNNKFGLNV